MAFAELLYCQQGVQAKNIGRPLAVMSYIAVKIDVTDALPQDAADGARVEIAAWVFPPASRRVPSFPTSVVLMNGGTYDKRYHHFHVPGKDGYSAGEALARRGHLVILPDHLGVGESSRLPDQRKATRRIAALANHAAVSEIYRRLTDGTLDPSLAPIPRFLKAGGGHSMGGSQSLAQQAEFETYDCLMVIGYSAIGVHIPTPDGLVPGDMVPRRADDYPFESHEAMSYNFHWDDVPRDVRDVDNALAVPVPQEISFAAIQPAAALEDAGTVRVPVYICLGERDVSPRPHDESGCYRSSKDVTLHILPRSGHCQVFASTRMQMIDRIDGWLRSLPAVQGQTASR